MRNPFFVEVKSDHGDIFATLKPNSELIDTEGITVTSFDHMQPESIDKKVQEITELPAGLKNFAIKVPN